jgi:CubicO group peptidase (beta-lactamase class C family)
MAAIVGLPGVGCRSGPPLVRVDVEPAGEWLAADPSAAGMDGERLRALVADVSARRDHGIDSVLVVRGGKLVLEQYWNGYDSRTLHDLRSATKSITSLLVGIALREGFLRDVSDPMLLYLDAAYPTLAHDGAAKRAITVEHLLTMASGLACDDRDASSPGQEDKMYDSRDWVRFFLDLPVVRPPGAQSVYCTGGVVALGRILSEASRRSVPSFADEFLFGPLGVAGARWATFDPGRQTDSGGHLRLRPRDMAKLGLLVLQRGRWNGREVVPEAWIARSVATHTRVDGQRYGYLWWLADYGPPEAPAEIWYASGNGGQHIFVAPRHDLVVVFTGSNYNSPAARQPFELLTKYIFPAVREGPAS